MLFRSQNRCRLWAHNWKYDLQIVRNYIGDQELLPALWGDTMILAALLGRGFPRIVRGKLIYSYGLKDLSSYWLKMDQASYQDTLGDKKILVSGPTNDDILQYELGMTAHLVRSSKNERLTKKIQKAVVVAGNKLREQQKWRLPQMNELSVADVAAYAADDALATLLLAREFFPSLVGQKYGVDCFDKIEMGTVACLASMYHDGVCVDAGMMDSLSVQLKQRAAELAGQWWERTGLDIRASKENREFLYSRYWPTEHNGRSAPVSLLSGMFSYGKEGVAWAKAACPRDSLGYELACLKEQYAKADKLATTYFDSLASQAKNRHDGKIHASFMQTGTETGRFSCKDPNLQNQPRSVDGGPDIRAMFTASKGYVLVDGDWSSLEVGLMAELSRDPALVEMVLEGGNMHDLTAAKLGLPRAQAKTVNFALQYGAGATKIAVTLGMEVTEESYWKDGTKRTFLRAPKEAIEIYDAYHAAYSGISEFRTRMGEFCRKHGYVETAFGRRRYIPEIDSYDKLSRWHAERAAANMPIQGTAADIAKIAMVNLKDFIDKRRFPARILLQVHDELVCEVEEAWSGEFVVEMKRIMEAAGQPVLQLPLRAEVGIGKSWSEAK